MKRLVFVLSFLVFVLSFPPMASAQDPTHRLEFPRWREPGIVGVNREPARSAAHEREEQWLQELEGWESSETVDAVTFSARFKVPFEWIDRRQILHLDGVSASFDVVVNGKFAGYSQAGSLPVEFDLTEVSREGMNTLEIVVYKDPVVRKLEGNRDPVAPRLLGEARIVSQPLLRVRDVVVSARASDGAGLMELGVVMKSHRLNPLTYTITYELLAGEGARAKVLAWEHKEVTVDMRREDTVRFFANARGVEPWDPTRPTLYTLKIETVQNGRTREQVSYKIGFREVSFTPASPASKDSPASPPSPASESSGGTLFVNGKAVDFVTDVVTERVGVVSGARITGAETAEEPAMVDWLEPDKVALVCVQADIDTHLSGDSRKIGGNPSNDPVWGAAYTDRVLSAYHSSKLRPEVVAFSLGQGSSNGINMYESYIALKALEPSRPVVYLDSTDTEWNTDLR